MYKKIILHEKLETFLSKYSYIVNKDIEFIESLIRIQWFSVYYINCKQPDWCTIPEEKSVLISMHLNYVPRIKFTLSHELCHVLMLKYNINWLYDEFNRELICDEFAWRLLVSDELLKEYWNETQNVNKLSEKFWVSEVCMEIRLDKEWLRKSENLWLVPIFHTESFMKQMI